jgi:hypothetical protein
MKNRKQGKSLSPWRDKNEQGSKIYDLLYRNI